MEHNILNWTSTVGKTKGQGIVRIVLVILAPTNSKLPTPFSVIQKL